ncbi:hypothetical protein QCA50_016110 [Cerrena zonata]|uniref:Uncharacterized protein n=1 Tax=Cerrena zonata TaxID=2478898 RepID=A0AAW0FU33_9APHY
MIILDEKMALPPPPPYAPAEPVSPPPFPYQSRIVPTLATLPPNILLQIVYATFGGKGTIEKQRQILYWLNTSLRAVCRTIYVACMHVLRSTYIPAYTAQIRPPYSSDPFPLTTPTSPTPTSSSPSFPPPSFTSSLSTSDSTSPVLSLQRETRVLDLFIALKVREDVWLDDSELHLGSEDSFRDLFELMQPRSRLEDLVRVIGVKEGVISVPNPGGTAVKVMYPKGKSASGSSGGKSALGPGRVNGTSTYASSSAGPSSRRQTRPTRSIPFSSLSASFSTRKVGLILTTRERKKTIVEVDRARDEKLEVAARMLVAELREWIEAMS